MDWNTIGFCALVITIVSQLAIWWGDRKNPRKLKWLRRLVKLFPIRSSEKRWLANFERQIRDLARHGLSGKVIIDSAPGPLDTRLGGPLIVPKGTDTPTNAHGQPLLPLLLIRLSDLPDTQGNVLPQKGWIQVLVEASTLWDMHLPTFQGANFRIIHHADGTTFDVHPVDGAVAREHPAWSDMKQTQGVYGAGLGIAFEPVLDLTPSSHYKTDDLPDNFRTKEFDDAFDRLFSALDDKKVTGDVMIGGHAAFTQEDIRYDATYAGFENLIRMSGSGQVFSWGDAGEASIMVPEADLGSGRLQNAIFYFDYH